jgi:hypothetical protein
MIGQFVFEGVLWLADFKLPAHQVPTEDLLRVGIEIGAHKGLWFEPSLRVTD